MSSLSYDELYTKLKSTNFTDKEYYDEYLSESNITYQQFRCAMWKRRTGRVLVESDETGDELESRFVESDEIFVTPSTQEVRNVLDRNLAYINQRMSEFYNRKGGTIKIAFVSDVHIPYQIPELIEMTSNILADFEPDIITGLNDVFDFKGYGRWSDTRTPAQQLWSSDIQIGINAHYEYKKTLDPHNKALWIAINGNHDNWLFRYIDENYSGAEGIMKKYFIDEMAKQGVYIWTLKQESFMIGDTLGLTHGFYASKNPSTVAKNTLNDFRPRSYNDVKVLPNVVYGHDHSAGEYAIDGVKVFSNGCLCRTDMDYLRGDPDWQHGITLITYDVDTGAVFGDVLEYQRVNKQWMTQYNGKVYKMK